MFNRADRSEALIPAVMFDLCNEISNVACFAGETGVNYNSAYGLTEFPSNIFKEYNTSGVGQKYISSVFCAFRNNNTASGTVIRFDQWVNPPKTVNGCYHMCNNLTGIENVPANYKASA